MQINNLVIEVTRKCNMVCDHCLRGCAQNKDIKCLYSLFEQVDCIGSITFSGGEPSLNTKAIVEALELCYLHGVEVGSFYIATNGLKVSEDFVIACLKWYSFCSEKDMCSVEVSNDLYHSCQGSYNTDLLDGLSFFTRKHSVEGQEIYHLLNEGYANDNGMGTINLESEPIESIYDFEDGTIYLNCNGEIISGCDWSYESQPDHKLCDVDNLTEYYNQLKEA